MHIWLNCRARATTVSHPAAGTPERHAAMPSALHWYFASPTHVADPHTANQHTPDPGQKVRGSAACACALQPRLCPCPEPGRAAAPTYPAAYGITHAVKGWAEVINTVVHRMTRTSGLQQLLIRSSQALTSGIDTIFLARTSSRCQRHESYPRLQLHPSAGASTSLLGNATIIFLSSSSNITVARLVRPPTYSCASFCSAQTCECDR